MDCKDDGLPKRFRKCDDPIDNELGDNIIDIDGLSGLLMSGSGQFSQEGAGACQTGDRAIIKSPSWIFARNLMGLSMESPSVIWMN